MHEAFDALVEQELVRQDFAGKQKKAIARSLSLRRRVIDVDAKEHALLQASQRVEANDVAWTDSIVIWSSRSLRCRTTRFRA